MSAISWGVEAFGAYAASKAALRSYTRTWANELKGRGIRVNAISPGVIDTPALAGVVGEENAEAAKASFATRVPIGRMGTTEEVAAVVAFLASEARTVPAARFRVRDPVRLNTPDPASPARANMGSGRSKPSREHSRIRQECAGQAGAPTET
ncbi:hypothetical protein GCM10010191_50380 [Actinomadura vinacea]|uniref:SDR family oxidoreductase n=1 Tax=Actinomadura vinacea TaxID=115336 RepID=A0ABP5WS27_9ACTN